MKAIYKKDTGDIIAWASDEQNILEYMKNWDNVDYANLGDITLKKFGLNPVKIDLITKEVIYPQIS